MKDISELKEFIESEDGKAAVDGWLTESGYKSADDISGLENKKNELLGKLKKANEFKSSVDSLFKQHNIVDSDDLAGKLATLADAQTNESDHEKTVRRLEILEKTYAEAEKRAESEKTLRVESEKKAQILSALKNAHVDDGSIDIVTPYFTRMVKNEEVGGKINLIVDTDDGPSPIDAFVEAWSKTDKAKPFIKAPSNTGGGATTPGGSSPAQLTQEQIAAIPDRKVRLEKMAELVKNS